MPIDHKLIDNLLKDYKTPEDILGDNGLLKQLTKAVLERAMRAELTQHLGYEPHDSAGDNSGNSRNGKSRKTLKGNFGELPIEVPRDRDSSFEPQIVPKGQTRFDGFDDKILSLYARGMTTREIQAHLEEIYQVEVSPALISSVTDAVIEEVKVWQNRPLDALYPILYLDALSVKVRDGAHIRNKAIYLVIGVNLSGIKEVLGLWVAQTEGAKLWLQIVTELKNRGVSDIFIACVDGLKGFPEAIETVFPQAQVQLCIVHLVRHSLNYVGWKQRKEVAAGLQTIYRAATREEAERRLEEFAEKWDSQFPTISRSWRSNWERVTPFFAYPADIRKVIYRDVRHRVGEHEPAQNHQEPWLVPDGRGGGEATLPGVAEHRAQMDDVNQVMEGGVESLRHHLRGQDACPLVTITYTKLWTRSRENSLRRTGCSFGQPHSYRLGFSFQFLTSNSRYYTYARPPACRDFSTNSQMKAAFSITRPRACKLSIRL